tara:strand:- start:956 stop:1435 length:480 start_codon:yes stop_codon:yes gene_type:complete
LLQLIKGKDKKQYDMKWIRTPKEIWEQLSKEFNFTIDACASDKNHLVDRYWTKEQDALKQDWNNEIIYCHPMFNQHTPKFIKKAIESNSLCVFLLPASTNSKYFHDYLWCSYNHRPKENIQIRFLQKPKGYYGFHFANENGEIPKTGYLRPLMIIIINK